MKFTDVLQKVVNLVFRYKPQPKPKKALAQECKIVAHRGAWDNVGFLENTLPAFARCVEAKVWSIEFDLQWTKDNVPIIHHDSNTLRVFKKNILIKNISFKDLRSQVPLIPTLEELVNLYGKKIHFMIELKNSLSNSQRDILNKTLAPLSIIHDYHFMSLDINIFKSLADINPQSFVAIGRSDLLQVHKKSLNTQLGALTGHYALFNNEMISTQHNLGRQIGVGFPDSKNSLYREINRSFDWIFTNHALELQEYLNNI